MTVAPLSAQDTRTMGRTCACYNLRRASRAVSGVFDARFESIGLKATQYTVLAALAHEEKNDPTVSALAEALVLDQSSLSRTLAVLDRDGLVRLSPGKVDRREKVVTLTRKGHLLVRRGYPVWQAAQEAVAAAFARGDFAAQMAGLRRLTRAAQGLQEDVAARRGRRVARNSAS